MINTTNYKIKHHYNLYPPDCEPWSFNGPGTEMYTSLGYVTIHYKNNFVTWYEPGQTTIFKIIVCLRFVPPLVKIWTNADVDKLLSHLKSNGMKP